MVLKRLVSYAIAGLMILAPATQTYANSFTILSDGKVIVYDKDGKPVSDNNLKGKNTYTEGTMVMCKDGCVIKSKGISILADKGTSIATSENEGVFNIVLKEGKVNFVILDPSVKINFYTTFGVYTVADVIQYANTSSAVKGYFSSNNNNAEVAIIEGGMTFATANGLKEVKSGEKIILAISEVPGTGGSNQKSGAAVGATTSGGTGTAVGTTGTGTAVGPGVTGSAVAVGTFGAAVAPATLPAGLIVLGGVGGAALVGGGLAVISTGNNDDDPPSQSR